MSEDKDKARVDRMLQSIRRQLEALGNGEIVSGEIGLLKVGAEAAFEAQALVVGNRQITIQTDIYPDGVTTEISLHRCERRGDTNHIFFITKDRLQPLYSIPEAIEVCGEIRERMQSGLSYEAAIQPFVHA